MKKVLSRKKTALISIFMIVIMLFSLAGCGKKKEEDVEVEKVSYIGDITENTLQFNSDGTLLEISCEDFSGTEVDTSNLEAYIKSEIDTFNAQEGVDKVSFKEYIEENGLVRTAIQFSDIDAFNAFNGMSLEISMYKPDPADEIVKAEAASASDAIVTVEAEEINEEELAEAGYDIDDLESLEEEVASESDAELPTVATFTDASTFDVINSDEINGDSFMMVVTDEPMNYNIKGGKILFFNKYAELVDESTAKATENGRSVIVYKFNY